MARRSEVKAHKADEMAAELFARLFAHARDIAEGKASPGPFRNLLRDDPAELDRLHEDIKALGDTQSRKSARPRTQNQGKENK